GIAWYQGESDAEEQEDVDLYSDRMEAFVARLRADVNQPDLPFLCVQLARVYDKNRDVGFWNSIQQQQLALEQRIENFYVVSAINESMADHIHVDATGLRSLGRKLAKVALGAKYGQEYTAGPRFESAMLSEDGYTISIRCTGANGGIVLTAPHPDFDVR